MVIPENMPTCNIIQTKQVAFRNIYVYNNDGKKRPWISKKARRGILERLEEGQGRGK